MKTRKGGNSVLRELRKIQNKHYEETKNMTIAEQLEYYRKGAENFDRKFSKTGKDINYEDK